MIWRIQIFKRNDHGQVGGSTERCVLDLSMVYHGSDRGLRRREETGSTRATSRRVQRGCGVMQGRRKDGESSLARRVASAILASGKMTRIAETSTEPFLPCLVTLSITAAARALLSQPANQSQRS